MQGKGEGRWGEEEELRRERIVRQAGSEKKLKRERERERYQEHCERVGSRRNAARREAGICSLWDCRETLRGEEEEQLKEEL